MRLFNLLKKQKHHCKYQHRICAHKQFCSLLIQKSSIRARRGRETSSFYGNGCKLLLRPPQLTEREAERTFIVELGSRAESSEKETLVRLMIMMEEKDLEPFLPSAPALALILRSISPLSGKSGFSQCLYPKENFKVQRVSLLLCINQVLGLQNLHTKGTSKNSISQNCKAIEGTCCFLMCVACLQVYSQSLRDAPTHTSPIPIIFRHGLPAFQYASHL